MRRIVFDVGYATGLYDLEALHFTLRIYDLSVPLSISRTLDTPLEYVREMTEEEIEEVRLVGPYPEDEVLVYDLLLTRFYEDLHKYMQDKVPAHTLEEMLQIEE